MGNADQRKLRWTVFVPSYGLALFAMGTVQQITSGPLGLALQSVAGLVVYMLADKILSAMAARRSLPAHDSE